MINNVRFMFINQNGELVGAYNYKRLPRKLKKFQKKNGIFVGRLFGGIDLVVERDQSFHFNVSREQINIDRNWLQEQMNKQLPYGCQHISHIKP